jgi:anaerobic magnesium-protoporphyrin IX monomethyl ester cyclase
VIDELEYLYKTYQVNVFLVTDEHPTRNGERWETFLDLLIARGLPTHLLIETKSSDIIRDKEIIGKYHKAGIVYISLGIEVADQAANDAKEALALIHGEGIVSEASFMLGLPDETPASVKKRLQLARHLNPDNANFFAVTPWPYSDLYGSVKQYIGEWDYSKYNLVDPVIEPESMSMRQVEVALAECYRKFYMGKIIEVMTMKDDFKRGYMMRATKLFMRSSFIFNKMCVGMLGKIPARVEKVKK